MLAAPAARYKSDHRLEILAACPGSEPYLSLALVNLPAARVAISVPAHPLPRGENMSRIRSTVMAVLVLAIAFAGLAGTAAANASTTHYNCAQLGRLWLHMGGRKSAERIAEGVAMAESGGYKYATDHDSNGSVDRGLWQINSVNGHWSSYNVNTNARGARAISRNGHDWHPWVTYNSGAYKHHCRA
jgi:hypothetical protein